MRTIAPGEGERPKMGQRPPWRRSQNQPHARHRNDPVHRVCGGCLRRHDRHRLVWHHGRSWRLLIQPAGAPPERSPRPGWVGGPRSSGRSSRRGRRARSSHGPEVRTANETPRALRWTASFTCQAVVVQPSHTSLYETGRPRRHATGLQHRDPPQGSRPPLHHHPPWGDADGLRPSAPGSVGCRVRGARSAPLRVGAALGPAAPRGDRADSGMGARRDQDVSVPSGGRPCHGCGRRVERSRSVRRICRRPGGSGGACRRTRAWCCGLRDQGRACGGPWTGG
jgi:hypothetical protein